jgi:two-component system, sensor histidine kinase RegB
MAGLPIPDHPQAQAVRMTETAYPPHVTPIATAIDGRVTLRTLILIRWIAVFGQLTAVLSVHYGFGFKLPLGPALAAMGASVLLNLAAQAQRGARPRLADRDAALYLGYDTLQLTLLLYLTGGLQNPFAILILAPLTVAGTILSRVSVTALTVLALCCLTGLALWQFPLPWANGAVGLPPLYLLGIWLALSLSAIFITAYVWSVAQEARSISDALAASQMALEREQRLSALGALAAAAAHELGTPLGTIHLVAKELASEIPPDSPLAEDIALLQSQSLRCRDILAELSRKPEAEGGEPFDRLTVAALIDAAGAPHRLGHIQFVLETDAVAGPAVPMIRRSPEIIHGLGNLIQNATQFARSRVTVRARWDLETLTITVTDDGPGFPQSLLNRIGEPYISTRVEGGRADGRPHMGLGIFIAQTLLERTGAVVGFANSRSGGAQVVVRWNPPIFDTKG